MKDLKFDGKEITVFKDGEEIGRGTLTDEELTSIKDPSQKEEPELTEAEVQEMQEAANKYMEEHTGDLEKMVINHKLEETEKLAEAYEELKKNYISMQEKADIKELRGDGGEDKTNPDYYRLRELESIEIMELKHGTRAVMAFCLLTSERYEYRVGAKNIQEGNSELDMGKADWYLNKYTELSKKLDTLEEIQGLSTLLG